MTRLLLIALLSTRAFAAEDTRLQCSDGIDNDADGMVDCADSDCMQFAICQRAAPVVAVQGGVDPARAQFAIGGVLLSLGVIAVGTSAALWAGIHFTKGTEYSFDTGFGACESAAQPVCTFHANDTPYLAGALILDIAGIASAVAGGLLVARAAKIASPPPKVAVMPTAGGLALRF